MRLFYLIIFVGTVFTSCFRDVHHSLQQVKLSSAGNYEIKSMISGCCGCKALYYNVNNNRVLTEQFVVETACGLYEPTKHIFTTDGKGKVLSFKSFVAVN